MKRWYIINGSIMCLLSLIIILVNYERNNIKLENEELYNYFETKKIISVNKKIDLSAMREENKKIKEDVTKLFDENNLDINLYLAKVDEEKNKNTELKKETEELSNKVEELNSKKNSLEKQYDTLKSKYNLLQENKMKESYHFPLINQYPNYPTGCESVALTMLLRYYDISVTPDSIINSLKKETLPYYENEILYGGNPELGFVGNPYSISSYGVYDLPIKEVANMYKPGIMGGSGIPFIDVENIANNGHPVQVWISMGLSVPYISKTWIYKPTMETISWKSGEHSVVVLSANDSTVVIADPSGGTIREYSRSTFENRYDYFGRKAVFY